MPIRRRAQSATDRPQREPLPLPEPGAFGVARANKTQFALAVVDPRIAAIERTRAARKLSHQQLCGAARIHPRTWFYLRRGEQAPKPSTLERLEAAIAAAPERPKAVPLAALVRAVEALLARAIEGDTALAAAVNDKRNVKGPPRPRLRTLALYLVAVEVEAGNAAIARALGMTRANVHKARHTIEELADDPRVRALLDELARTLQGEG